MADSSTRARGGCLCGAVQFVVRGDLRDVLCCHCSQCRRTHGHFSAYTATAREALELTESDGLRWFRSSARARRGFCAGCGASLFWDLLGDAQMRIAAGALDPPTGLSTRAHIFVADASDYYRLDEVPEQHPGSLLG